MDPFDLFEMFFTAGMGGETHFRRGNRVFRRRYHQHEEHENQHRAQPRIVNHRYLMLIQLLPFLAIFLFSVIPYLFNSVNYLN